MCPREAGRVVLVRLSVVLLVAWNVAMGALVFAVGWTVPLLLSGGAVFGMTVEALKDLERAA